MPSPITTAAVPATDRRLLRRWMFACIVAVFLAVAVGGITRLTESGLSITEWRPVSGILPPMTDAAWTAAFDEFLRIPQATTTHRGITLDGFKLIFWWEWFHRLLARGVGLVFAVPYVVLLATGRIPRSLWVRLSALPLLTLGQGVLGWYMVQSGLVERSTVSAYRLTAHLALALGILAVAVWTYDELREAQPTRRASARFRWVIAATTALISVTILSGGFVAGLRAGTIFNTFPLMGGAIVPPGYLSIEDWWRNAFENPIAAQFHHRVLAVLTGLVAIGVGWFASVAALDPRTRRATQLLAGIILVQVMLGIATLLWAVPITLAVGHQFTGVLALSVALVATRRSLVGDDR